MGICYVIIAKALLELPVSLIIVGQDQSFGLAMAGWVAEYFVVRGYVAACILALKTVVDPSITSLAVSMFFVVQALSNTTSNFLLGSIINSNDYEVGTPGYKWTIFISSVGPCIICLPFFWIAGR